MSTNLTVAPFSKEVQKHLAIFDATRWQIYSNAAKHPMKAFRNEDLSVVEKIMAFVLNIFLLIPILSGLGGKDRMILKTDDGKTDIIKNVKGTSDLIKGARENLTEKNIEVTEDKSLTVEVTVLRDRYDTIAGHILHTAANPNQPIPWNHRI